MTTFSNLVRYAALAAALTFALFVSTSAQAITFEELHTFSQTYVFEGGSNFEDYNPPFLRINFQDAEDVLPAGACAIRFLDVEAWYWGDPQAMNLNGNGSLANLDDFAVFGLQIPGCPQNANLPHYQTPLTGGQWLNGATRLVVQTSYSAPFDNIQLLDAWGNVIEPGPPPSQGPGLDLCADPDFCDDLPNPCFGQVLNPDLCEDSGIVLDLSYKSAVPLRSMLLDLDHLAELLGADPAHREAPAALFEAVDRLAKSAGRFKELNDAHQSLSKTLAGHPELDDQAASQTSRRDLGTSVELAGATFSRCADAVSELERDLTTGLLDAAQATAVRQLCTATSRSLDAARRSAGLLWSFGLAPRDTATGSTAN